MEQYIITRLTYAGVLFSYILVGFILMKLKKYIEKKENIQKS